MKGFPQKTDEDVRRYVKEYNVSFEEFVEEHRNKDEIAALFENLFGGTRPIDSTGGSVSYVDETGEEKVLASGGEVGRFTVPSYLKWRNRGLPEGKGRGTVDKTPVFGMAQRGKDGKGTTWIAATNTTSCIAAT